MGKNEVIKEKVQQNAIFKGRFNKVHLFLYQKRQTVYIYIYISNVKNWSTSVFL